MKFAQFWQGEDGIRNVKPNRKGIEFPEGFDVLSLLATFIQGRPVVEVGCGYGRLAPAFDPENYIGLDCNEAAIQLARKRHPEYAFQIIDQYDYPPSMAKLVYTVAMHIPDEEYPTFVRALCERTGDQVLVAEILGHGRRRKLERKAEGWIHATFGRDRNEHEAEFEKNGFQLVTWHERNYAGKNAPFTFLDFRRKYDKAA